MFLLAAISAGITVAGHAEPQPTTDDARTGSPAATPVQVCVGGLEDGKFIVGDDAEQRDLLHETTLEACRIDGGAAVPAVHPPAVLTGRPLMA